MLFTHIYARARAHIHAPPAFNSQGSYLRIGGQDEVLTYNRESDDAVLPISHHKVSPIQLSAEAE